MISTVPRGLLSGGQGHPNSHRLSCVGCRPRPLGWLRGPHLLHLGQIWCAHPPAVQLQGDRRTPPPEALLMCWCWRWCAGSGAGSGDGACAFFFSERRRRWCVPGHLFFSVFKDVGAWAPWGFFVFSPPSSVRGHLVPWKLAPSWAWPWRAELRPLSATEPRVAQFSRCVTRAGTNSSGIFLKDRPRCI